jgi:hypothetical protein
MVILPVLFLAGCSAFINIKPIEFSVYPGTDNTLLPTETTALSVVFDTPMDRLETQKALSVSYAGGNVNGDIDWRGNELFFVPLEPWLPGLRYSLNIAGTIYALDGRTERIYRYIPFYALNREVSPFCVEFSPANGKSVGVNPADGAFIRIVFSQPMSRLSSRAFSLNGVNNTESRWSANDTILEVYPKNPLNPWTVYNWSLSTKAVSSNGVPLGREISGQFVTDADRLLPAVKGVYPLIKGAPFSGSRWVITGAAMENGLGSGQAIGIEFNKPMDESVLRNIRFDPSLVCRTEMWKDAVAVIIPEREAEPERLYTLIVSTESRDTTGLKMEKEYRFSFTADIPYLKILSLDTGFGNTEPEQNGAYPLKTIEPEGVVSITLRFSHIMETPANTVLNTRLEPFFPGTLKPIALRSVQWVSSDTARLQWEGITKSIDGEKHYYRLILTGGKGGISDGKGSYLKEDIHFYLEGEDR